jgi:hypothetical protein
VNAFQAELRREVERAYRPMRTPWCVFKDWWAWVNLRSHRYCRRETDSMGTPCTEKLGTITRAWTARHDSVYDQAGRRYYVIKFDDGDVDRTSYSGMYYNEEWDRYEYTA